MVTDVTVVRTRLWCAVIVLGASLVLVDSLNGDHVCMVQQKYNITKRVKYRAPMSVRTYEWCFSMPPRCSKWKTEMRELTKLETDERIAEVAVCCPGYKMKDVSCVPICPNGKTGHRCSEDCPENQWGPNCVNECGPCKVGICSPVTGDCSCQDGWQGESCGIRMPPLTSTTTAEDLLTKSATKPTPPITSTLPATRASVVTTLETTPTTLIEFAARPSNPKPVIETPISVSNSSSLKATVSTITPLESSSIFITTLSETSSIKMTKKPTAATKATTILGTTPLTTNSTTEKAIKDLTEAITAPSVKVMKTNTATVLKVTTTTEIIPLEFITEKSQPDKEIKSIQTSTIRALTEGKTTMSVIERILPTTATKLPKTTLFHMFSNSVNVTTETPKQNFLDSKKAKENDTKHNHTIEISSIPKTMHELKVPVKVAFEKIETTRTSTHSKSFSSITDVSHSTTAFITEGPTKIETTKRPQSTIRYFPTTVKFKPKEIWIRPAQKGEPYKSRTEPNQDLHSKPKTATQPYTTQKTIMVSIIPTSVSYATFKKIALSTTPLLFEKTNTTNGSPNTTTTSDKEVTKPMSIPTTTELARITLTNVKVAQKFFITSKLDRTKDLKTHTELDKTTKTISTFHTSREFPKKTVSQNGTNSMTTIRNLNSSNSLTTPSTNAIRNTTQEPTKHTVAKPEKVTRPVKIVTVKPRNVTIITVSGKNKNETVVKITKTIAKDVEKTNATFNTNQVTTESADDEEFHILTEPEHITAVMEGKEKERSTVDLISVISIAGGIMMAVITVAVVIVMVERCKRPRYEDRRKVSDIRMQVMIDNDVPPPYVRSIFHTPLPDPPTSEKCHYQPISTLDRNLKQFMRPVVVQTISPIMLENFRGILECHYDHLPRRSHDYDPRHFSEAPSVDEADELTRLKPCCGIDSTIDALKCEARLDVLDSTTSEPLYAEIPCWRPPSEHAVEILNLNGEAVTEL